MSRAAALSEMAYVNYPCVLAYRSTRALLLAATDRAQAALGLLEYMNYDRGTPDNRSHRAIAQAFALRRLNRTEEAQQALAAGLKLTKKHLPWLTTIDLIPK
jgi:predicted RNA polymerase sigma factor